MFSIAKLTSPQIPDGTVNDVWDSRTSNVNLVQMNTKIIDSHKNWDILLLKEAVKINEKNCFWTLV